MINCRYHVFGTVRNGAGQVVSEQIDIDLRIRIRGAIRCNDLFLVLDYVQDHVDKHLMCTLVW